VPSGGVLPGGVIHRYFYEFSFPGGERIKHVNGWHLRPAESSFSIAGFSHLLLFVEGFYMLDILMPMFLVIGIGAATLIGLTLLGMAVGKIH